MTSKSLAVPGFVYFSLSLPDEETEQRMSFSICQLNDALQHASLTQLICVYLEIALVEAGITATVPVFRISQLSSGRAGAAMMDSG